MWSVFAKVLAPALTLIVPFSYAHGHLAQVAVNGGVYTGANPNWVVPTESIPNTAAWFAYNLDNGFVDAGSYHNHAITCHKGASPGTTSVQVEAGSQMGLKWNAWPESHSGPVLTYLAKCPGPCTDAVSEDLEFFKIDEQGLLSPSGGTYEVPEFWATEQLIKQNFAWTTTIPSNIEPGHYVLRHEIIALHRAHYVNEAQNYPMCVNLEISGTGRVDPCTAGADCRKGTDLYRFNEPGVHLNIFSGVANYTIPGPPAWHGLEKSASTLVDFFPTTTTTARVKEQTKYARCGGLGWKGPTNCLDGTSCQYVDEAYSQCL